MPEDLDPFVIFLDMDGVLNTPRVCATQKSSSNPFSWIDPVSVKLLNRLTQGTEEKYSVNVKIVLSSSWRTGMEKHDFYLMTGLINLDASCMEDFKIPHPERDEIRGDQIDKWLARNPEVTKWLIVDDESDFHDHQKLRLIQTSMEDGILLRHYHQAEEIIEQIIRQSNNPSEVACPKQHLLNGF